MNTSGRVYCFVVGLRYKEDNAPPIPSGTLTVVSELIKNWGTNETIFVLCNNEYTRRSFLAINGNLGNVKVEVFDQPVLQEQLARMSASKKTVLAAVKSVYYRLISPWTTVKAIIALKGFFLSKKISVVYSHNGGYPDRSLNLLAIIGAKMAGVVDNHLVLHNMPTPISKKRYPFSYLQDRIIGFSSKNIVSVSRACASVHSNTRHFGVPIGYVYNGLSIGNHSIKEGTVAEPEWKAEAPVLMFLGSLQPRKGVHFLVEALAYMKIKSILVIYGVGNAEYTKLLKEKIHRLGLSDRVFFEGYDRNASEKLQYADVLVLPSVEYESFGMVILEAMLHKKPVVCSDYGGMQEVVENGVTGFVTPAGDSKAMAIALDKIVDDSRKANKMGEAGYQRLLEKFDISRTVQAYKNL